MKKSMVLLLILGLVLGVFGGCSSGKTPVDTSRDTSGNSTEYTADNPLVIRISFLNAPTDSSVNSGRKWAEMLKERSEGRIDLQVFPSGELGGARENFQAMQEGTLEMASLIPGTIAGFDPRLELSTLPGLIIDEETAIKYDREGFIGQELYRYYDENGIIRLIKGEPNFYHFFTTNAAGTIGSLDEMVGKKLRIPESPMLKLFFEKGGAIPTPMPWGEIYTGLQRNVIHGTVGNLIWSVAAKFHEVANNITLLQVQYTPSDWLFSKKAWERVPKDLQQIILDSIPDIEKYAAKSWNDEIESNKKMLREQGVKIIELPKEQQIKWQKDSYNIWKDYALEIWGKDLIEKIEKEVLNLN